MKKYGETSYGRHLELNAGCSDVWYIMLMKYQTSIWKVYMIRRRKLYFDWDVWIYVNFTQTCFLYLIAAQIQIRQWYL